MPERPVQTAAEPRTRHLGDLISRLTRRHVMIGATASAVSSAPVSAIGDALRPAPLDLDDPDQVTDLFLRMSGVPQERPAYSWILARVFTVRHGQRVALYDQCSVVSAFHEKRSDGVRHIERNSITELRKLETEQPLEMLEDPDSPATLNVPESRAAHEEMDLQPKLQQIIQRAAEHTRTRHQISSVVSSDGVVRMTVQEQTVQLDADGRAGARTSAEQRTYQANQTQFRGLSGEAVASQFTYHREQMSPLWMKDAGAITEINMVGAGGAAGAVKDLPPTAWHLASQLA